MENNKNKKSVKFQGDMLDFCDFIHVFVFTTNHHLKDAPIPGFLRSGLWWYNWGFLLFRIFSVAVSVSPRVCFILDLVLISMF